VNEIPRKKSRSYKKGGGTSKKCKAKQKKGRDLAFQSEVLKSVGTTKAKKIRSAVNLHRRAGRKKNCARGHYKGKVEPNQNGIKRKKSLKVCGEHTPRADHWETKQLESQCYSLNTQGKGLCGGLFKHAKREPVEKKAEAFRMGEREKKGLPHETVGGRLRKPTGEIPTGLLFGEIYKGGV